MDNLKGESFAKWQAILFLCSYKFLCKISQHQHRNGFAFYENYNLKAKEKYFNNMVSDLTQESGTQN